ncbi:TadA family conjugal transfer-associated ATPase [Microbacterium hominis]|uniref:TadA family conjugal transfer-associated ATPase n=1 Tax=Microbacterium hominis TaxID=162426 RepID=A0A7D4PLB2_9MICO|nr:TadA family conjugal transfer-associated ATPase [Microbacterium hominis]QKJ18775.1 TadA family conjugal transfer-associated ATPase [Microbacterium hominis]
MPDAFVPRPRTPHLVSAAATAEDADDRRVLDELEREAWPSPADLPRPWVATPRVRADAATDAAPAAAPEEVREAPTRHAAARLLHGAVHPGVAALAAHLDDPAVTDLFVNGAEGMFVDRGDGPTEVARWRAAEEEVRDLAVALIGLGGRHLDDAAPCVDVRLEGGIRVHAVLPPVSATGTLISVRVPRVERATLTALAERGMFGARVGERLHELVARRENVLVTGAAGAGKTTLLAALLAAASARERLVTIEDVAELNIDHPHHVRLEARQPNLEGAGAVSLTRLVREALRMRPDRLVVGECRGEEVRELLSALNTGHDGGAGTVHANSIDDVPARMEALGALAGLDPASIARQVASAIGCVLHVSRGRDGVRRLAGAGRPVVDETGRLVIERLPWECA